MFEGKTTKESPYECPRSTTSSLQWKKSVLRVRSIKRSLGLRSLWVPGEKLWPPLGFWCGQQLLMFPGWQLSSHDLLLHFLLSSTCRIRIIYWFVGTWLHVQRYHFQTDLDGSTGIRISASLLVDHNLTLDRDEQCELWFLCARDCMKKPHNPIFNGVIRR